MEYLWLPLVGGAAAFPHCLGMCGGFALYLSSGESKAAVLFRQACWHAGRITTYAFLGALAGALGGLVSLAKWPAVKDVPGYLAGAVMVIMGLFVLGLFPSRGKRSDSADGDGLFTSLLRQFFQKPSPLSALCLGLATGFLPCPITVSFLALSAERGGPLLGIGIMVAMGLGTVWSLLVLGMTGHMFRAKWKQRGAVLVGIILVLMGTWTILRKAKVLPPLPGVRMKAERASDACITEGIKRIIDV